MSGGCNHCEIKKDSDFGLRESFSNQFTKPFHELETAVCCTLIRNQNTQKIFLRTVTYDKHPKMKRVPD